MRQISDVDDIELPDGSFLQRRTHIPDLKRSFTCPANSRSSPEPVCGYYRAGSWLSGFRHQVVSLLACGKSEGHPIERQRDIGFFKIFEIAYLLRDYMASNAFNNASIGVVRLEYSSRTPL